MNTYALNFLNTTATIEEIEDFFKAIQYQFENLTCKVLDTDIARLKKQLENLEKSDKEEDKKRLEGDSIRAKIAEKEEEREKSANNKADLATSYDLVVAEMTAKDKNGFGNKKEVVESIFSVIAASGDSRLMKCAISSTFTTPKLAECLQTIHVDCKAGEDGNLVMSKAVKEAYKEATKELDSIIKNAFSLPFVTKYTDKTRVKMNSEDRKLLHDCSIKGFSNKFTTDEKSGKVSFKAREINTLVRITKNRKGETKVNYDGLAVCIANIVLKHYFA